MTTSQRAAALAEIEAQILEAEGPWHVDGRYFAKDADARQQRHWAADRRLREEERRRDVARRRARERKLEELQEPRQPTLREMAQRQRAVFEATGDLIVGDESGYMLPPWATPSEIVR